MSYLENAKALRSTMDAAGALLSDTQAVQVKGLYKEWASLIGTNATNGQKFRYGADLYKVTGTDHIFSPEWEPGHGTESLYTKIDEDHTGTLADPIPYSGNMELFEGKYYTQDGVVYHCTRSTGQAVYHALADLVGLYVEVVTNR